MNKKVIFSVIVLILLATFISLNTNTDKGDTDKKFILPNLKTNTDKASIDLNQILSGGPGKDGIPSIDSPKFVSKGNSNVEDDVRGILVDIGGIQRFYPYSTLVWHEIVNDNINETYFAVTFCPLCDTGIVFNRNIGGEVLSFGVSGFLYESNLLMYDRKTESLWSQARGDAVVGDYLGTRLNLIPLQLITFKEAKDRYQDLQVLSEDTGFSRNYKRNPYSGYEDTEDLFFSVSIDDNRFKSKELFYIVPFEGKSLALQYNTFPQGEKTFLVDGEELVYRRDGGEIYTYFENQRLPGYFEFWFSWSIHHQEDGVILK